MDSALELLKSPMDLPEEFKSWLLKYIEVNPPNLPIKQMLGYQDGPKIRVGAISDGPPANPKDGDIWIATGIDTNGTVWQFRYNAGSTDTHKWEFIGGSQLSFPIVDANALLSALTSTGHTNGLAETIFYKVGTTLTVPRAGDYIVTGGAELSIATATTRVSLNPIWNGLANTGNNFHSRELAIGFNGLALPPTKLSGINAGTIVVGLSASTPANVTVRWNAGGLIPVRIS